jgi:glycosyltransferase involved in cell wall biosynthesis
MPKISAIVITLDEEGNLPSCLETLRWIDEIVVLDSGSRDKTREIARRFTPQVYETEWKGFGETKNLALAKATGEWILWVDADERVTPELSQEIRKRLEADGGRFAGYEVPRLAFFLGHPIRHSGWYPGYVLRLFKKGAGRFTTQPVHEGVTLHGKIGRLRGDLLHDTDPTLEHYIEKMNRYTTLAADELYGRGKRAGLFDLVARPKGMFLKMYLLHAGFLDGIPGFLAAILSAYHVFTKYAKLWERRVCPLK